MMSAILPIHVLAGGLGLLSGYLALYAAKGAPLHRKVGIASGVLLPIAAMSYWLWRLRTRNHVRGMQKVTTYELRNAHSS